MDKLPPWQKQVLKDLRPFVGRYICLECRQGNHNWCSTICECEGPCSTAWQHNPILGKDER